MAMNVCGIKEHEFQVSLNKKILVVASILTLIFDIFSGGVLLRQHGKDYVLNPQEDIRLINHGVSLRIPPSKEFWAFRKGVILRSFDFVL